MNTDVSLDNVNKRAMKELEAALDVNETVKAAVVGRERQILVLTDHRLIIANGTLMLRGHDALMLSDISKLSSGMSAVAINVRGGDDAEFNFWPKGKNKKAAQHLVETFRSMQMAGSRANSAPEPNTPQSNGVADELVKLGNLREKGLLSVEEFETQKAKLLSR